LLSSCCYRQHQVTQCCIQLFQNARLSGPGLNVLSL
jgi:hypothetical protein